MRRVPGKWSARAPGGYVYLHSSMTTLDVRTTLQCGEVDKSPAV